MLRMYRWRNRFGRRGAVIRDGRWLRRMAARHNRQKGLGKKNRTISGRIRTGIRREDSLARETARTENYIESLLDRRRYSEKRILAVINPYGLTPLAALLIFNTEQACQVRVRLDGDYPYSFTSEPSERHRVPVFYLHAGKNNPVQVELLRDGGVVHQEVINLPAAPLPQLLQNMVVTRVKKRKSASPMTFVYGGDTKFPYVFDENGEIRYFLRRRPKAYGLFPLSGGRFLFLKADICAPSFSNPHSVLGLEMDFLGRVYREYFVPEGIHHDGCEMEPEGNLLLASSSLTDYVEDAVVEVNCHTGEVVKKLGLAEVLSEHPYLDSHDWAHVNTVSWIAEEHAVLICMRNLHTVMKLDWRTDEIRWILCDTTFWAGTPYEEKVLRPEGEIAWSYQPHAAYMLPKPTKDGRRRMIIYDNHWHKRRPVENFDGDRKSYVRIYAIDEENHTVSLLESYGSPKSKIRSNGILKKKRVLSMSGYLNTPLDEHEGMITEFSRKTGKVINRYLTYNSFYRAYPFFVDFEKLCRPVEGTGAATGDYVLGYRPEMTACGEINGDRFRKIPKVRSHKKAARTRKKIRKEERIRAWKNAGGQGEDNRREELAGIKIKFYEEMLLLYAKDHLLEKVYLQGRENTYIRDYTDTEQKVPQLFADFHYYTALPLCGIAPDKYEILVESGGVIYETGKRFKIKE